MIVIGTVPVITVDCSTLCRQDGKHGAVGKIKSPKAGGAVSVYIFMPDALREPLGISGSPGQLIAVESLWFNRDRRAHIRLAVFPGDQGLRY